ncbi:unnamed protein product, partial [Dibothriocephalus latus]
MQRRDALAGSSWGQDTGTLVMTYRATGKATTEHASVIFAPLFSGASWAKVQRVENAALRIATGCVNKTNVDHLYQETQVLPLKVHSIMQAKIYIAQS